MKFYLHKHIITFVLIVAFLAPACSWAQFTTAGQAEKQYEQGNFDESVRLCVQTLRKKSNSKRAIEILPLAFKAAFVKYEDQVKQLQAMSSTFVDDNTVMQRQEIVDTYQKMMDLQNEVKSLPEIAPKKGEPLQFDMPEYYEAMATARENLLEGKNNAAEMHYNVGTELMQYDDLDKNKQAAKEFKRAMQFVPNYSNCAEMYDLARKAGTKRIAIIPFDNKSGKYGFGAIGEVQSDLITAAILGDREATEFLEVITRDRIEEVVKEQKMNDLGVMDETSLVEVGKLLGVHELLTGKITQVLTAYPQTVSRTYTDKASVVVSTKKVVVDGKEKTQNVYGDVTANVTEYTKKVDSQLTGSYSIVEVKTGRIIQSDMFTESYSFSCVWGQKSSGDDRALSMTSKNLVGRREEIPPTAEAMVNKLNEQLAKKLAAKVIEYAK